MNEYYSDMSGFSIEQLTAMSNDELVNMYKTLEMNSPQWTGVMNELKRRGFTFKSPKPVTPPPPPPPPRAETPDLSVFSQRSHVSLRYSKIGSLIWEIIFLLLGLAVGVYLVEKISTIDDVPWQAYALPFAAALLVISLGAVLGGIRQLANLKGNAPSNATNNVIGHLVLIICWILLTLGFVYYGVDMFLKLNQWDTGKALLTAGIFLAGALVCATYATIFWLLSVELKKS